MDGKGQGKISHTDRGQACCLLYLPTSRISQHAVTFAPATLRNEQTMAKTTLRRLIKHLHFQPNCLKGSHGANVDHDAHSITTGLGVPSSGTVLGTRVGLFLGKIPKQTNERALHVDMGNSYCPK